MPHKTDSKSTYQGYNAVLDLIITDIHKFYEDPEILPPLGTSDHRRIVWRPKNRNQLGNKKGRGTVIVRPLRDSSILQFEQFIREYNWSFVFNAAEVDDGVRLFLEATNNMFDTFFPCKSIKVYEDDKPYITGRIKEMMHNRDKAYQRGQAERFISIYEIKLYLRFGKRKINFTIREVNR